MGKRFVSEQPISVVDQEPRRIQHHQHFGGQSLGNRFASLARDRLGDLCFLLLQPALKFAQHRNSVAHSGLGPGGLRQRARTTAA